MWQDKLIGATLLSLGAAGLEDLGAYKSKRVVDQMMAMEVGGGHEEVLVVEIFHVFGKIAEMEGGLVWLISSMGLCSWIVTEV